MPAARAPLILVAEDNETNRKVILLQLELIGFAAQAAHNGVEALARWRSGAFTLLLTDLQMPLMDGYTLARTIRAEEPADVRAPIIALTASVDPGQAAHCRDAGIDLCLTKPARLAQLQLAIEAHLQPAAARTHAAETPLPAAAPGPPVDLTVLAQLVGDDPIVIGDVLRSFHASAVRAGAAIQLGAAALPSMAAAAHRLKAAARSIGAQRLGELCAGLESAGATDANPRGEELDRLLTAFASELAAVLRFVDATAPDRRLTPAP